VCGRYIRMQCIAPLTLTQLQSSTRGLISIAKRRSRPSLKLNVPGARSLFCRRHDTGTTLHAWQRIGTSGAKLEPRVHCGETVKKEPEASSHLVKLAVAVAGGGTRNQPHGLHVHRGEPVSNTVVDPRQLASDARMPTIYVGVGLLLRRRHRHVHVPVVKTP
jgi:hypothetical protein